VQRVAMLTAAFAEGRSDLLARAMEDRMHQPYRSPACPLLPLLLPVAGGDGVLGVALSGAGPSVLLIVEPGRVETARDVVGRILRENGMNAEALETKIFHDLM